MNIVTFVLAGLQAHGAKIDCNFTMAMFENEQMYSCFVNEITVTRNDTQMIITGNHLQNKTDLDVQVVDMHSLPSIVTEFFSTFPNLRIFVVSDLFYIQQGAFKNAQHLKRVTIMNSPLRVIPAYAFEGAPNILTLNFIQCETTTIDENALFGMADLEFISLFANLQNLPENVFSSLNNLKSVFLVENSFETIHPALFDNNLKLFTAYFSGNKINAVAKSFVEKLYNRGVNQFTFTGNNCGNSEYNLFYIDRIHSALNQCYRNYEEILVS